MWTIWTIIYYLLYSKKKKKGDNHVTVTTDFKNLNRGFISSLEKVIGKPSSGPSTSSKLKKNEIGDQIMWFSRQPPVVFLRAPSVTTVLRTLLGT